MVACAWMAGAVFSLLCAFACLPQSRAFTSPVQAVVRSHAHARTRISTSMAKVTPKSSSSKPQPSNSISNVNKSESTGRRRRRKDNGGGIAKKAGLRNLQYPELENTEEYEYLQDYSKNLREGVKNLKEMSPNVDQYIENEPGADRLPQIDFSLKPSSKLTPITGLVPEKSDDNSKEPTWIKKLKLAAWVGIGLLVLLEIVVHLPFVHAPGVFPPQNIPAVPVVP